jgi:phosphatidylinositol alpha-1,6-mannosyltransferase
LLLIGSGSAKRAWQRLCIKLGLAERVIWRDAVPWTMMGAYYSAANVFAMPSYKETGPRTVLEAFQCGCPVIVTPETGVVRSGICVDGESAVVVAPDDVEGWTRALELLLADTQRARAMAATGKRRMGPAFSFSSTALQMVRMFDGMIANRTALRGSAS